MPDGLFPTDATEVERAPRRAPSVAQPSSPAMRGAGEDGPTVTGGPVQGWAGPLVTHLVQYSTGVASAEIAWRVVEKVGPERVHLLTADVRKEDPDNWRFAHHVADKLGCDWTIIRARGNPMQIGREMGIIPNNRMAVCSRVGKRELLRAWMNEHCDPATTLVHVGYDWTEQKRIKQAVPLWAPYTPAVILAEPPYTDKPDLIDTFRARGIEPPSLYKDGFPHANCSGGCVRGGQAQYELLLRKRPEEYAWWEAEEEESRRVIGKDVSILRDRRGGTTTPLTLRTFREQLEHRSRMEGEQAPLFDPDDWGACSCFGDEVDQ